MTVYRWHPVASVTLSVSRNDGLQLAVFSSETPNGQWVVMALETREPPPGLFTTEVLQSVFDQHAHQTLDPQPTLPQALALGERYATWWLGSRATHFTCACADIPATVE